MRYYDIKDDLKKYPDAWCYLIWSKRGPGKTYSILRHVITDNVPFVFLKRTVEDVQMLCSGTGKVGQRTKDIGADFSPFKPLNRDFGWNIHPFKIDDNLAGFWDTLTDEDGNLVPLGKPAGYAAALSVVSKYKGFDMSEVDMMIFDEFIPKPWERQNHREGDALMDMYMTVSRDRVQRGRGELKLVCLANATMANNPVFLTLDVTDIAVEMDLTDTEYYYDEDRGILLHYINWKEEEGRQLTGIEKAMQGTQWGAMAFGGHFGYNDLSNISKNALKRYQPVCTIIYNHKQIYVYRNEEGRYHFSYSRHNSLNVYNMARENEQMRFYQEQGFDIREALIDDRVTFEKYTMYDLILNFKKYFKIS